MHDAKKKTEDIQKWWDQNPFTFGVAKEGRGKGDQVGRVNFSDMDISYFREIERRFRKHSRGGGQEDGAPLLSKLVDYGWLRGKKVLDIAVGSGFSMVAFVEGGAHVTGIDLTDFAVEHAKRNLNARGLQGSVVKMDAQALEFEDNSFDFVNAWGCLMHMPETEKAISEMYRVTKKEGRVLAYMYNKSSWPFWFNLIFLRGILLGGLIRYGGNVVKLCSRYSDGYTRGGNVLTKFYTPRHVEKMFESAGFINIRAVPWKLPDEPNNWPLRKFPIFKYLPEKIKEYMAQRWGYGLIVTAQKV